MAGKKREILQAVPPTGLGIIRCNVCGDPLADHDIVTACPKLKGERMTVPRGKIRRTPKDYK